MASTLSVQRVVSLLVGAISILIVAIPMNGAHEALATEISDDHSTASTIPNGGNDLVVMETTESQTVTDAEGFDASDPEVRHLIKNWGFAESDALVIANFQLFTGNLAADMLLNSSDIVGGVELLIGGRDDGVREDEVLLEIGVVSPEAAVKLADAVAHFEERAIASLDLTERVAGRTAYHNRSEALREGVGAAHVRLIDVPSSHDELQAEATQRVEAMRGEEVIQAEIDWRSGVVTIIETGRTQEEMREWGRQFETSDCHTSQSQYETAGDFNGGRLIQTDKSSSNGNCNMDGVCTLGMPTTIGNTRGFFTAAHCFPTSWQTISQQAGTTNDILANWSSRDTVVRYIYDEQLDYAWGAPYWKTTSDNYDVGVVIRRWAYTTANGQIWKYDNQLWRNITAYEDGVRAQGYDVCQPAHGKVSNNPKRTTYCAEVVDSIVNRYGYDVGSQLFTETYYPGSDITQNEYGPGGGASGGPMFYGSTTYGINHGWSSAHGTKYGIYNRWGPIHDLFQQRFGADADFICYSSSGSWGARCNPS